MTVIWPEDDAIRWGRYLAFAAGSALAGLAVAASLVFGTQALGRPDLPEVLLLRHQVEKLDQPLGDVIFVGDSSLGTGVSATRFSSLTKIATTNLALTGAYGIGGSRAMLEAVLARKQPVLAVIVQTPDMMMRSPSPLRPELRRQADMPPAEAMRRVWLDHMNVDQIDRSLEFIKKTLLRGEPPLVMVDDYVIQVPKPAEPPAEGKFDPDRIDRANLFELREIAALCARTGTRCLYMHGPLQDPWCRTREAYFAAVNAVIAEAGLEVAAPQPVCLTPDLIGNSYDHASPAGKPVVTARFADTLAPWLDAATPPGDEHP